MMNRCLYCYKPLSKEEYDFHPACCKKMFGDKNSPQLPYSENQLEDLAKEVIKSHTAVTGVQPKLSLHLSNGNESRKTKKFTI
ncbi:MAG: hypothetical protein KGZ74_01595, partial [Chitinophagaceae bacterium]|nr:hypothetical protein [Chitinophagaceae bacterium]